MFDDMYDNKGRIYGFYRALVVDNEDPEKFGRVKVWSPDFMPKISQDKGLWALPSNNPISGLNEDENSDHHYAGSLYIPPKGSYVQIFFEAGNPNRPYYFCGLNIQNVKVLPEGQLGNEYWKKWVIFKSHDGRCIVISDDEDDCRVEITGKKRKITDPPVGDTDSVYTIDENQTTVLLDERDGKEKVLIRSHKGDFINFDVEERKLMAYFNDEIHYKTEASIFVKAAKDIHIKANENIHIEAGGNINIKAGGSVNTLSGETINNKAADNINSESSETINQKSGSEINLECSDDINLSSSSNINSSATKDVNISSTNIYNDAVAETNVKGQNVNIQATAELNINGTTCSIGGVSTNVLASGGSVMLGGAGVSLMGGTSKVGIDGFGVDIFGGLGPVNIDGVMINEMEGLATFSDLPAFPGSANSSSKQATGAGSAKDAVEAKNAEPKGERDD